MAATTLNSGQKSPNITLSGGSLVATSSGTGGVKATRPLTGKAYFEGTITTLTGTPSIGIAAQSWTNIFDLGSQNNTLGYLSSGAVKCNGFTIATIATYAAGNIICCAIDPLNKLAWFRVGTSGNWNNSGTADPATGVGGIDFGTNLTLPDTFYPAVEASLTGTVWTMNFSSPAGVVPTGFAIVDTIGYTKAMATTPTFPLPGALPAAYGFRAAPMPKSQTALGYFNGTTITKVSGVTKEGGSPIASKKVEVYDRITGELLGTTISDGSGAWEVPCLGRPAVRVVGSDPTTYNSVVFDNVAPV